jgi:EAL domain-containing protein (putative c-di-GMP-specific phosphodiesterase class I)
VAAFIGVAAEFGCQFAIDRYRGVAGLAALRNFPVNYIKLHDSLLVSRSADIVDRAQLEWLVHSAHLCGAKVVAVGIRDEDMLARARELKVDFVQGFALAPPSPWGD